MDEGTFDEVEVHPIVDVRFPEEVNWRSLFWVENGRCTEEVIELMQGRVLCHLQIQTEAKVLLRRGRARMVSSNKADIVRQGLALSS